MRKTKSERKRKCRVWLRVIIEIVFTSCGILSTILPEPYDVYALLTIGVLRVILSAVQRERKSEEPPMIVYCNGEKEPQRPEKIEKPATVDGKKKKTGKSGELAAYYGGKNEKRSKSMTVILFIASGFFVGLGFLFQYLNTHDEWLYWCSIGSWALAGVFALWAIISIILWAIDRRRRKAQLWHKRYVDLAAAQNTQKIILEFPQELGRTQEYLDRPISKNASRNKSGKGKRKNGKR